MKLLILDLCNYIDYPLGGQLTFVKNLIAAFGKDAKLVGITTDDSTPVRKWTKRLINGTEYDYYSVAKVNKSFNKPFIPGRITSIFRLKPCVKDILKDVDYDLIYVQAPELLFCLSDMILSNTFLRMPGVENPLSISRYPIARNFQKQYDYFFMKKVAKVKYIFASAAESELHNFLIRSKGKISREQLVKYPTRYKSTIYFPEDKLKTRRELGLQENAKIITTVGRLGWFKGWKFMIDAFKLILHQQDNAHFFFIGDGEDRELVESYIKSEKLESKVSILGSQPPSCVAKYLNASDVFVMGSYKEGWSTTLVEACGCCLPCVVTDFSSAEEMIKDGINGYVVKNRSEHQFAEKIIEAFDMKRDDIIKYNQKYKSLAVSGMRESIESVICKK